MPFPPGPTSRLPDSISPSPKGSHPTQADLVAHLNRQGWHPGWLET